MVIRVDRPDDSAALRKKGTDPVAKDFSEIGVKEIEACSSRHGDNLPLALQREKEIEEHLHGKRAAVFLDYDGTLTPIVDRPDLAIMSDEMRTVVRELAASCTTAIVSGRSRVKVYEFVRLDGIFYAGSHGFDIVGPDGCKLQYGEGKRFLPTLNSVFKELSNRVKEIEGVLVEHTGFSISVHYRLVAGEKVARIEGIVDELLNANPTLRKTHGKRVFEIRPKIDWDKGKAVAWILHALDLDRPDVVPVYLGDDTTDEDAFRVVGDRGMAILVADSPRRTAANYRLKDTLEVQQFLERLISIVRGKNR